MVEHMPSVRVDRVIMSALNLHKGLSECRTLVEGQQANFTFQLWKTGNEVEMTFALQDKEKTFYMLFLLKV